MALPQHLRLRGHRQFQHLHRDGKNIFHPLLKLSLLPNQLPHNRYGFIVSTRLGNAVCRNRIRRRLREAVRVWHESLHQGYDVVIIARTPGQNASYHDFYGVLQTLFRRAKLLNGQNTDL